MNILKTAILFPLFVVQAFAQEVDTLWTKIYYLPEVVVTATRTPVPLRLAPASVSVITALQIEESGAENIGQILQTIPGANVGSYGGMGALVSLSLRGSTSTQVLFLLDGRPINDPQKGDLDLSNIPLNMIKRVEIIRGGASALYGANAMGGVVNVITKSNPSEKPYSKVAVRQGSYNTTEVELEFGRRLTRQLEFYLTGSWQETGGFRQNSDYEGKNQRGKIEYKFGQDCIVKVAADHHRDALGVPGPLTSPSLQARQEEHRTNVDLSLDIQNFQGKLYHSDFWLSYKDPEQGMKSGHQNLIYAAEVQQTLNILSNHSLTLGGNWQENRVKSTDVGRHTTNQQALFVQDEWKVVEPLRLVLGTRFDDHSVYGSQWNPQVVVSLNPRLGINFSTSLRRAFRAPTFNDLYWPDQIWVRGNPNLIPERGWTYDLGVKCELPWIKVRTNFFRNENKDMIKWSPEDPTNPWSTYTPQNLVSALIQGIEGDIEATPSSVMSLGGSFTLSEAKEKTSRKLFSYHPKFQGSAYLQYEESFLNGRMGLKLRLSGEYTGKRYVDDFEGSSLPAYAIFNSFLTLRLAGVPISYRIQNLFNKSYETRKGYPMPGRTYTMGLSWEFWD